MAMNEWDIIQVEPVTPPDDDPWAIVGKEPAPEPSWTERVGRKLVELELGKRASEFATEDVAKPFARGFLRARVLANLAQKDYEEAAALNRAAESYSPNPEDAARLAKIAESKSLGEAVLGYTQNPDLAVQVAAESLPLSAASLATGATGAFGGGAVGGPLGAAIGGMAGTAAGSFATEYLASMQEFAGRRGVDFNDPQQIEWAFNDPVFMGEAREFATARGIPIAAFDALSFGIAGKLFRTIKRAPGMGGTAGTLAGSAAEVTGQAGAGMAGEAGAQLNAEGRITSWGEIAAEGVGEIVPGAIETATRVGAERLARRPPAPAGEPRPDYAEDASPEERARVDELWRQRRERQRARERYDAMPGDGLEAPAQPQLPPPAAGLPPPQGGRPGPEPAPGGAGTGWDIVSVEPAPTESTEAGAEAGAALQGTVPAAEAPAPVEPPTVAATARPVVPPEPPDEDRGPPAGWTREPGGGISRELTERKLELPEIASAGDLVRASMADPPAYLQKPANYRMSAEEKAIVAQLDALRGQAGEKAASDRQRLVRRMEDIQQERTRQDFQKNPERYRKEVLDRAQRVAGKDTIALDHAIYQWAYMSAQDELGRDAAPEEVYKRAQQLKEAAQNRSDVIRARGAIEQRRNELRDATTLASFDVKLAEAAGHAVRITNTSTRRNADGTVKESTSKLTDHYNVVMNDGRELGVLFHRKRSRKGPGYEFRPAKGLDKDMAQAIGERFGAGTLLDPRDDARQIANFVRDWEAGKRPTRTIEGEATEVAPKQLAGGGPSRADIRKHAAKVRKAITASGVVGMTQLEALRRAKLDPESDLGDAVWEELEKDIGDVEDFSKPFRADYQKSRGVVFFDTKVSKKMLHQVRRQDQRQEAENRISERLAAAAVELVKRNGGTMTEDALVAALERDFPKNHGLIYDALDQTDWDKMLDRDAGGDAVMYSLPGTEPLAEQFPDAYGDRAPPKPSKAAPPKSGAAPVQFTTRTDHKALICASCSSKKDTVEGKIPAEDRYAPGSVVSAMAKLPVARRPDILFLSAKYGLIAHSTRIENYDQKLNKAAADKLIASKSARNRFLATLAQYKDGDVMIAAGGQYRRVFEAWLEGAELGSVKVEFARPQTGLMRKDVKQFAIDAQPYGAYADFAKKKIGAKEQNVEPLSNLAKRAPLRERAAQLAAELVKGGGISYVRDEGGDITGRTGSQNPDWAQALLAAERSVTVERVKEVGRKLVAGEALGVVDTRVANALLEVARLERAEGAGRAGGWRALRAPAIDRQYDDLFRRLSEAITRGNEAEQNRLRAKLDWFEKRHAEYFGYDDSVGLHMVESPVESPYDAGKRVLKRGLTGLWPTEKRALAKALKERKDRARILKMLHMHAGTPWAAQAIEGLFVRQAAKEIMAGRTPDFQSALDSRAVAGNREWLAEGPEGLWLALQANDFLSEASKPVNNLSSSFVNCSPSTDCARYCYATGGNYRFAGSIVKAELVTLAVESDPKRAAREVAREYKGKLEFHQNKALRLFDKGDMGEGWVELIQELNRQGVRVQVFSRRPELLRQISDKNVRMLSIDESNLKMADENPDLPVAFIYSSKAQVPALAKLHARGQVQVVLPIKQGQAVLTKENVLELRKAVKGIAPYICPIDAGYKKLQTKPTQPGWNCTKCDARAGIGCFHGAPTKGIMSELYPPKNRAELQGTLRRLLHEYRNAEPDEETDAAPGSDDARQSEGLIAAIDALIHRLDAEHDPGRTERGSRADRPGTEQEDGDTGGPAFEAETERPSWFFSPLERAVENAKITKATGQQWAQYLLNQPGVKREELEDIYLLDYFATMDLEGTKPTKEAVLDEIAISRFDVSDVVFVDSVHHPLADANLKAAVELLRKAGITPHGDPNDPADTEITFTNRDADPVYVDDAGLDADIVMAMRTVMSPGAQLANFEDVTEPGGKDYFELALTVPVLPSERERQELDAVTKARAAEIADPIRRKYAERLKRLYAAQTHAFTSGTPELAEGWNLWDDTDNHQLWLLDPTGKKVENFGYGGDTERQRDMYLATARRFASANSLEYAGNDLEDRRDNELVAALTAAGMTAAQANAYIGRSFTAADKEAFEWRQSHWGYGLKNPIVTIRAKERLLEDGGRVLAVEEFQSDMVKAMRRTGGKTKRAADQPSQYDDRVPDFPFKKSHYRLAMRRMLRWAAEHGYDYLAWTPGDIQGVRYNALTWVKEITLTVLNDDGTILIQALPKDATDPQDYRRISVVQREELGDWIGPELAKEGLKRLDEQGVQKEALFPLSSVLKADNVLVGSAKGYRDVYDKQLTQEAKAVVKKAGGRVETVPIGSGWSGHYDIWVDGRVVDEGIFHANLMDALAFTHRRSGGVGVVITAFPSNASGADIEQYEVYDNDLDLRATYTTRWKAEKYASEIEGSVIAVPKDGSETKVDWHAVKLTPPVRELLLQPLALYQQQDLFGLRPGRELAEDDRKRELKRAATQGDLFGAVDPKAQAAADRQRKLDEGKARAEDKVRGDKSVPADIGKRGDLFTTQKDVFDESATREKDTGEGVRQGVGDLRIAERPGTTAEQRELKQELAAEWADRLGRKRGVTVLGLEISRDFRETGSTSLVGRVVRDIHDYAVLAQIFRDPRFETLRVAFVKGDLIVGESALTSRLPSTVSFTRKTWGKMVLTMAQKMADTGADGWFLLHNHPAGSPTPSDSDLATTKDLAAAVRGFRGHVVIDHDAYAVIDAKGKAREYAAPGLSQMTYGRDNPMVYHPLLGERVKTVEGAAALARQVNRSDEVVTLLGYTGNPNRIVAILNVPLSQLQGARGIALIRRLKRNTGSHAFLAAGTPKAAVLMLPHVQSGVLFDAINLKTGNAIGVTNYPEWFMDEAKWKARERVSAHGGGTPSVKMRQQAEQPGRQLNANPLEALYRRYQRVAQRVIDRWNDKIGWRWDALGKLPRKENYLTLRYLALGKLTKVREISRDVYDVLSKASAADQQAIYDYLTTAGARPDAITDPALRRKSVAVKRLIDRIGRTLVLRGMLSPQAYARYKDAYLPRLYLKHILGESAFSALGSGRRLSDLGYLRRRRDIPVDDRVLLGEILDPAFLASHGVAKTMRDLAIVDFLEALSGNADWVAPQSLVMWKGRRVSPFWLKREADSLRQRAELYGPQNKAFAQNVANRMDAAANAALANLAQVSEDFEQLPDSPRYGILRGAWVRKEIHQDLVGSMRAIPSNAPDLAKVFESGGIGTKLTQLWKTSKVALNPPAQVRNFLSNMILVHLSGVAMWRIPALYARAINELRTHGRYWRIARKYGLFESTFANAELFRIEEEWLDLQRRMGQGNALATLKAMAAVMANTASDVYQLSESIGKIAKMIDAIENDGLSESEAMIEAHKWLFDYSLVGARVQHLRNAPIGIPFVTFYYKVTARLGEAMIKHPVRFLPYILFGTMMAAALKEEWDLDDDELEKLRQAMPNWIREKGHVWILPYKDQHGRWQVFDFSYLLPWGMHVEILKSLASGDPERAIESLGVANGPIPSLFVAFKTGVDAFSKKPIYPEGATPKEQLLALLDYMWTLAAPPFVTSKGWLGKTYGALTGKVNPYTGDPGLDLWQAQLRLVGLNVYPVDARESRQLNIRMMVRQIDDTRRAMRKALRDKNLTPEERAEIRKSYRGIIQQKQADLAEYKKASAYPMRLEFPEPLPKEPGA